MQGLKSDLLHSARRLARTPIFTVSAVATLALGVGINTALFGIVNAVLLKSSRALTADGIAALCLREGNQFNPERLVKTQWVEDVALAASDVVEGVGGVRTFRAVLSTTSVHWSGIVKGEAVFGDYFAALGVRPRLGRLLGPADDVAGAERAVVLSESIWARVFGSDPAIVGRAIRVGGELATVVGIAPRDYRGFLMANVLATDVWIPQRSSQGLYAVPGAVSAIARLKPRISMKQADAVVRSVTRSVEPARPAITLGLIPLSSAVFSGPPPFYLAGLSLLGLAALVVFIACANLTNLLLARLSSRTAELAVRQALGAGRLRLLQLLGAETCLLAIVGGGLGLLVSIVATRVLTSIPLPERGGYVAQIEASPDWRVFAYAFATVLVAITGITAALARRASAVEALSVLSSASGSGGATDARGWIRANLIAGQMASAVVLLMGATLLVRATIHELNWDPGVDTAHVALGELDHTLSRFSETTGRNASAKLLDALGRAPGVTVAALASELPGSRLAMGARLADPAGVTATSGPAARVVRVSPQFFDAFGLKLLAGRAFTASDDGAAQRVAILSESAAAALWPGRASAIGRLVELTLDGGERRVVQVVGVAADVKVRSSNPRDRRVVFVPLWQHYAPRVTAIARGGGSAIGLVHVIRETVRQSSPDTTVFDVRTLTEYFAGTSSSLRLAALLLSALGILGMVVACVGLYGLVAYTIGSRAREFGIMKALGAANTAIYGLVLRQCVRMLLKGIVPGVALGWGLGMVLRSFIATVQPLDATLLSVPLLLFAVGLIACVLPLRRAVRDEPAISLRQF